MNGPSFESGLSRIERVAESLREGDSPQTATVRELLAWFGQQRRGWRVVGAIENDLRKVGLVTDPDFTTAYIDGSLTFALVNDQRSAVATGKKKGQRNPVDVQETSVGAPETEAEVEDRVLRVRMLPAANRAPIVVNRDDPVDKALTLMAMHDYSQLPATQDMRNADGMISWRSILLAQTNGQEPARVGQCTERHEEVRAEDPLLTAFQKIVDHEAVLVRGEKNQITGIVTATDLSVMFREQTEPFLLLSEIENQLRRLLDGHFSTEELKAAKDPADREREVEGVTDLTFGECTRLLEKREHWGRLRVGLNHKTFVAQLEETRRIRNDVMHFDPDGLLREELQRLRDVRRLLQRVL